MTERRRVRTHHKPRSRSAHPRSSPSRSSLHSSREQLAVLESNLTRAKQARDSYVDYLRDKYPAWSPSDPVQSTAAVSTLHPPPYQSYVLPGQVPNAPVAQLSALPSAMPRGGIMNRLETSKYFWDPPRTLESYPSSYELLPTSNPIPTGSIYFESELPQVKERLQQIRRNVQELRTNRLSMPTSEYFSKIAPDLKTNLTAFGSSDADYYGTRERATVHSLAKIRARILNLELTVEKRTREILDGVHGREERRQVQASLREPIPMPNWLREQKSLVQEMAEDSPKTPKASIVVQPEPVVEATTAKPTEIAPPETSKTSEPSIAPTRSFVLNQSVTGSKSDKQSQPPEPPKPPSAPAPPPDNSYQRMLDLLKPQKYDLSTSSSDDEPVPPPTAPAVPPTPAGPVLPTFAPTKTPSDSKLSFLFGNAETTVTPFGGSNIFTKKAEDSDDDFFN